MVIKIAFRNIFRQKRRSVFTALAMFGGFWLAAVSIGFADGTYGDIIDMFTRTRIGHVQVHRERYLEKPSIYKAITDYRHICDTLRDVRAVEAVSPRLFAAGLVSVGTASSAGRITGIDPAMERRALQFEKKIETGRSLSDTPSQEVVCGVGLMQRLEASLGDTLVVVSQAADGSIANDMYTIVGSLESGDRVDDQTACYMHLADAQRLFALQGRVHEIAVVARRSGHSRQLSAHINSMLAGTSLQAQPWQEIAHSFYRAMKADKNGMWIMLFIIILVVAVGVLNTVLMVVLERRREYGLLKALGTRPAAIFWLILAEMNILAVCSVFAGAILGTMTNYVLSLRGIPLPHPFSYGGVMFTAMHTAITARTLYLPAIVVCAAATLVSILPAVKAVRTDPAVIMQTH